MSNTCVDRCGLLIMRVRYRVIDRCARCGSAVTMTGAVLIMTGSDPNGIDNDSVRMQRMAGSDSQNALMADVVRCTGQAAEAAACLQGCSACHQRLCDARARIGSIQGKPLYSDDAALRRPHYVYESCFVTVVPLPWASSALSLGSSHPPPLLPRLLLPGICSCLSLALSLILEAHGSCPASR